MEHHAGSKARNSAAPTTSTKLTNPAPPPHQERRWIEVQIHAVLDDRQPHTVSNVLEHLGDKSGAARRRVQRSLEAMADAGEVAAEGNSRSRSYSKVDPF